MTRSVVGALEVAGLIPSPHIQFFQIHILSSIHKSPVNCFTERVDLSDSSLVINDRES